MSMKIACWNVRGINIYAKQRALKDFIAYHRLNVLGILETKVKSLNKEKIKMVICPNWEIVEN